MSRCSGESQNGLLTGGETIELLVDEDTFENRTGIHKCRKEEDPQSESYYVKPSSGRSRFIFQKCTISSVLHQRSYAR